MIVAAMVAGGLAGADVTREPPSAVPHRLVYSLDYQESPGDTELTRAIFDLQIEDQWTAWEQVRLCCGWLEGETSGLRSDGTMYSGGVLGEPIADDFVIPRPEHGAVPLPEFGPRFPDTREKLAAAGVTVTGDALSGIDAGGLELLHVVAARLQLAPTDLIVYESAHTVGGAGVVEGRVVFLPANLTIEAWESVDGVEIRRLSVSTLEFSD